MVPGPQRPCPAPEGQRALLLQLPRTRPFILPTRKSGNATYAARVIFFLKISIMPHLCTVETEGQQFMGKQDVVLRVHARAQLTGRRGGGVGRGYENEYVCV